MTTVAFGLEMSLDTKTAALAAATPAGDGWQADLAFYGDPQAAAAEAARLYEAVADNLGVFLDASPCAPLLGPLRAAGAWLHLLEAVDVAAASGEFTMAVRAGKVRTSGHQALREAVRMARPRSLLSSFAFERRRVAADMSPLNASAFAVWGLRRNQETCNPSVWVI
jgi:hypothetical protein